MRLSESECLRFNVENLAFQQEQAEITAIAASLAQIDCESWDGEVLQRLLVSSIPHC